MRWRRSCAASTGCRARPTMRGRRSSAAWHPPSSRTAPATGVRTRKLIINGLKTGSKSKLTFIPQSDGRSKHHQGGAAPRKIPALRSGCPASSLYDFLPLPSPTQTHRPRRGFPHHSRTEFHNPFHERTAAPDARYKRELHTIYTRLSGKAYPARSIIAGRLPAYAMSASERHLPKAGPQNGHSQAGSMSSTSAVRSPQKDKQRSQLAASEVIDGDPQLGNTATYRVVSVRHHDSLDGC